MTSYHAAPGRGFFFFELLVGYLGSWNPPVEKNQYLFHHMLILKKYQPRSVPGIKAVNLFALQHIKRKWPLAEFCIVLGKDSRKPCLTCHISTTTHFL